MEIPLKNLYKIKYHFRNACELNKYVILDWKTYFIIPIYISKYQIIAQDFNLMTFIAFERFIRKCIITN